MQNYPINSFTHLHVASSSSLQYGVSHPPDLVAKAAELGQQSLALTDLDTVAGSVSFVKACLDTGIAPIVGVDLALSAAQVKHMTPSHGGKFVHSQNNRVTLLAHNKKSWAGLCQAISLAHLHESRHNPQIAQDSLIRIAAESGLVVLLGPKSAVGKSILNRRDEQALQDFMDWKSQGVDVHLEIATHQENPNSQGLSDALAARMLNLAISNQTSAVLTNMVRYLAPGQSQIAQVLDAARIQMPISSRSSHNNQAFLADTQYMVATANRIASLVGDPRDVAKRLLYQTKALGERCVIDPDTDMGMNEVYVPELEMLLPHATQSADFILRERCQLGVLKYLDSNDCAQDADKISQRIDSELDVIQRMGYAGYVLTVAEVVDMIKKMGIRVAARGSGAGSFVNHVLGISGVDPIRHNLLMERFISTLRPGLPDIDIDVESARRIEIYDAIFARFGKQRTTCVSMRETYRVRHAIRDVGAALSMPPGEIDIFAKSFPHIRAKYVRSALAELPELRRSGLGVLAARGDLDQFLNLVEGLDGLPRHIAMHPCGIVLSDKTLLARTPVQPSAQGYSMSQFDKHDVENMGLLKLDVLGVRMQSALAYAVNEVERIDGATAYGVGPNGHIDLESVPQDDKETFALIQSTKTLGCFQIESPGQRELIGKFAPETFGDLITDISLFRPGPVKSDMITPFLRARQGWAPANLIHPDLEEILYETCGVVVFHEQVMRIISVLTGCSLEYSDLVRRRMGNPADLDAIREWFYRTLQKRNYTLKLIEEVWDVLRAFASFGFCKAHAAAFALPTYQSAWFKAHHPAAFLAGVLTHDPGMYPKRLLIDEARSCGVSILGLDVNLSQKTYKVETLKDNSNVNYGIRIALSEVKGICEGEVNSIINNRPYRSLADFVQRAGVSRGVLESIVLVGGFDSLHEKVASRRDLLFHLTQLAEDFRLKSRSKVINQISMGLDYVDWQPDKTGLPPMTLADLVKAEIEILGIDVSAHVVSFYHAMLSELGVTQSTELLNLRSQSQVLVAGVKVSTQTPPIRSGKRVAFVTLDDSTGPVDVTFFEAAQDSYATTLFSSWLLLARGQIRRTGPKGISIVANGCWELSTVYQHWRAGGIVAVRDLLANEPYDVSKSPAATQIWEHASGFRQSPYADVKPASMNMAANSSNRVKP